MKRKLQIKLLAAAGLLAGIFLPPVYAQSSGGDFTIRQAVVSNGGGAGADAGNTFFITGTLGQTFVGNSSGKSFNVYGGFLFPQANPAPTAAEVTVGGQVLTADGRGIRSVYISMTDAAGEIQTALSNSFGYYRFSNVPAGGTYIFTVSAKRFQFSQTVQVRFVREDTGDINFVAVR